MRLRCLEVRGHLSRIAWLVGRHSLRTNIINFQQDAEGGNETQ